MGTVAGAGVGTVGVETFEGAAAETAVGVGVEGEGTFAGVVAAGAKTEDGAAPPAAAETAAVDGRAKGDSTLRFAPNAANALVTEEAVPAEAAAGCDGATVVSAPARKKRSLGFTAHVQPTQKVDEN